MKHSRELVEAFNADGDSRMVWATYREDRDRVYYLPDGAVDAQLRSWAKAELACVIPECDLPLTAHSRSTKRDGFAHQGKKDEWLHRPESVLHKQGKAAVLSWVRRKYPHVRVDQEVVLEGGQRRPDVYAVSPSGNKMAFEVQYSGLEVAEWQERHHWFEEHGIVDVWLFGHTGPQRLPSRLGESAVSLNALQRHIAASGVPLWWIEPLTATIATPVCTQLVRNAQGMVVREVRTALPRVLPPTAANGVRLVLERLEDATLTGLGLRTPAYQAAAEALRRCEAAMPAEPLPAVAVLAPRPAATARPAHVEHRVIASREELDLRWAHSPLPARLTELFGEVPPWLSLDFDDVPDTAVGLRHEHWQGAAFEHAWHVSRRNRHSVAPPRRSLPGAPYPFHLDDFVAGVQALALPFDLEVLRPLVERWLDHLLAADQLGRRLREGRTTIVTQALRVPVESVDPVIAPTRPGRRGSSSWLSSPVRGPVDPSSVPPGFCIGCRGALRPSDIEAGSRRHLRQFGCAGPV